MIDPILNSRLKQEVNITFWTITEGLLTERPEIVNADLIYDQERLVAAIKAICKATPLADNFPWNMHYGTGVIPWSLTDPLPNLPDWGSWLGYPRQLITWEASSAQSLNRSRV